MAKISVSELRERIATHMLKEAVAGDSVDDMPVCLNGGRVQDHFCPRCAGPMSCELVLHDECLAVGIALDEQRRWADYQRQLGDRRVQLALRYRRDKEAQDRA